MASGTAEAGRVPIFDEPTGRSSSTAPVRGFSFALHVPSPWKVTAVEAPGLLGHVTPHSIRTASMEGDVLKTAGDLEVRVTLERGPGQRSQPQELRLLEAATADGNAPRTETGGDREIKRESAFE